MKNMKETFPTKKDVPAARTAAPRSSRPTIIGLSAADPKPARPEAVPTLPSVPAAKVKHTPTLVDMPVAPPSNPPPRIPGLARLPDSVKSDRYCMTGDDIIQD